MLKRDIENQGVVSCPAFISILHNKNCFLSREELVKLFRKFGHGSKHTEEVEIQDYDLIYEDKDQLIQYKMMSQGLNLHQNYLEYIQNNRVNSSKKKELEFIG
jgi:Ca2+-binding EF-hand superfamily protein